MELIGGDCCVPKEPKWKNCTDQQKIERTRDRVRCLQDDVRRLEKVIQDLLQHHHASDGSPSRRLTGLGHYGSNEIGGKKDDGDVYF